MTPRVLLDAGNSRVKWAVAIEGHWRAQGESEYDDLSGLAAQVPPSSPCYIASVTTEDREAQLLALLRGAGGAPIWLRSNACFGDLRNTYNDPQQLGVDRWMGLIAARKRTQRAVLVVSVGTAMTVDALAADGTFLGGLIVPGPTLMQRALQQGTARACARPGSWQAFPRTTADAVHSGIVAALGGAVRHQYTRLEAVAHEPPRCLLTGGGSQMLAPHLAMDVEWVSALVLEGIDWVAQESEAA